jgi:predicted  nucleic acid-binding Zn-ribbon protein
MLAGVMAAIQQSNVTLQESFRADLNSVRADLRSENEKLIKRFEAQTQETKKEFAAKLDLEARRLTNLVGKVQQETGSGIATVKKQMQTLSTDFDARLEEPQTNTQVVINELAEQIADQRSGFEAHLAQLGQEFNKKLTRQKESLEETTKSVSQEKSAVERRFEQVDAKVMALESKICEIPVGTIWRMCVR